jgi:hypothetical protein
MDDVPKQTHPSFLSSMVQTKRVIYVQSTNGNNLYDHCFQYHSVYSSPAIRYADHPISPRQSHRMDTDSSGLDIGVHKPRQVCKNILNIKPPNSWADDLQAGISVRVASYPSDAPAPSRIDIGDIK